MGVGRGKLLFTASLAIPVLVTVRIPDRAPPSLAFPTSNKILVSVSAVSGRGTPITITPNPGLLVREFVREVYHYLLDEVMPEKVSIRINWEGEKNYPLGLSVSLTYSLVKGLEALYEESFETEDLIGILSSLLMERGIGRVESEALSRALVKKSIVLSSLSGERVEHETDPVQVVFYKRTRLSSKYSSLLDNEVLDMLAKTASYLVFGIMQYLSMDARSQSNKASLSVVVQLYNSIWKSIYSFTGFTRILDEKTIFSPSLPGELVATKIKW